MRMDFQLPHYNLFLVLKWKGYQKEVLTPAWEPELQVCFYLLYSFLRHSLYVICQTRDSAWRHCTVCVTSYTRHTWAPGHSCTGDKEAIHTRHPRSKTTLHSLPGIPRHPLPVEHPCRRTARVLCVFYDLRSDNQSTLWSSLRGSPSWQGPSES